MPGWRWVLSHLVLFGLLLSMSPIEAGEPEQVSIQTLLSPQAMSYQRRVVTVEGLVSQLTIVPPHLSLYHSKCPPIYGRGSFTLDDQVGSLLVELMGSCSPAVVDALPMEGDHIRVTGIVAVLSSEPPRHVILHAMSIQILDSVSSK